MSFPIKINYLLRKKKQKTISLKEANLFPQNKLVYLTFETCKISELLTEG